MTKKATTTASNKVWKAIEDNCQRVAEDNELVQDGARFTLTEHQTRAIAEVGERLQNGEVKLLLKAPTGSGKTEVFFRSAVNQVLSSGKHVVIMVPTRDLARQQANYFEERLQGTDLEIIQMHAGIPPRTRRNQLDDFGQGNVKVVVGSAMMLKGAAHRRLLDDAGLLIVDDVNAFDEDEDLVNLRGLRCPILYVTATPEAVGKFLGREGVLTNPVLITQTPFDSPPTVLHEVRGEWNENIFKQMDRAMDMLKHHVEVGSRIYLISKTRARVPIMAQYVLDRLGVPVSILHGEMADSIEHKKRQRKTKGGPVTASMGGNVTEDRVSMMKQFRENSPAVLVATNLVGSGLDVPMADLVVVTDADHFGAAEIEQLMGRVGRREKASDAVLIKGTAASAPRGQMTRSFTRIRKGKVVQTFRLQPKSRRGYNPRRVI